MDPLMCATSSCEHSLHHHGKRSYRYMTLLAYAAVKGQKVMVEELIKNKASKSHGTHLYTDISVKQTSLFMHMICPKWWLQLRNRDKHNIIDKHNMPFPLPIMLYWSAQPVSCYSFPTMLKLCSFIASAPTSKALKRMPCNGNYCYGSLL